MLHGAAGFLPALHETGRPGRRVVLVPGFAPGAAAIATTIATTGRAFGTRAATAMPATQPGRTMPSQARRRLGRSGVEKPVRILFSRLAEMGMSTVTTSVPKPARATRSISASIRSWSPGM